MYPKPTPKRKTEVKGCARVLTSAQSRALLAEKECKKVEQQNEKERKKKEREEKRLAKEEEKKKKDQEREAKKTERQRKAEEKAKEKKEKRSKVVHGEKTLTCPRQKRRKVDRESDGLQSREISLNECAVCFGLYEEDFD